MSDISKILYKQYATTIPKAQGKPDFVPREIYLDNSATTRCDPDIVQAMLPFFTEEFGNSGSTTHSFGNRASEAVEQARSKIAEILKCSPNEFIFTSGATESNNIAIKGAIKYLHKYSKKRHIITLKTEHKCVLESCKYLENEGFEVTYLTVDASGIINLDDLNSAIRDDTGLVSIAYVHNEIGVIQPVKAIYRICQDRGAVFHTDAAQAVGRIEINSSYADLISFSAHKFYGPKGIGGLYIKRGVRLAKIVSGGGQEKGLRSGTLPVPLCVGMGEAMVKAEKLREVEYCRIAKLRNIMLNNIMSELPEVYLNGDPDERIPHNLNLSFSCVESESLLVFLDGIAASSGSACTSSTLEPSYVLKAIGTPIDLIHTSLRFTIGRFNTQEEILYTTHKIIQAVTYLRTLSPMWDLKQDPNVDFANIKWIDIH